MPSFPNVEEVCEQLLEAVGHTRPPTDLTAVCSLWPDLEVDEEDLDKEGYLIPLGNLGAEILIRRKDPFTRKKFTLAHELGHWTLANLTAGKVSFGRTNSESLTIRTEHKTRSPEEAWCNKFAASLLMPVRDIRSYLNGVGEGNLPEKISEGHLIFKVAEEAFLSRVRETTPISIFEVASFDGCVRVRRSYFNASKREEQVKEILDELLDSFRRTDGLPRGPVSVGDCWVQTNLTRNSQYSCSWLVTVTPVAYYDGQSRPSDQVENIDRAR
jgi:Zn-dependent peptidase ImmA (M78 family)